MSPRIRFPSARVFSDVVPILAYHKVAPVPADARHPQNYVEPNQFERQLRFLRLAGFTSISFAEYLAYRRGDEPLPPRPILITFDDGYRRSLETALLSLNRYGFVATVFVVSELLGFTNAWDPEEIQEPLVSRGDIARMQRAGLSFQSHTATHARLTTLSEDALRAELTRSKDELEKVTSSLVNVIAYPWGEQDGRVRVAASECGYEAGVVLRRRTNFPDTPLLELRRIGVNYQTSLARFAWDLARLRLRGDS